MRPMIQDELQQRVHAGERDAFRELYGRYSREVYALAHTALGNAESAHSVVKQVFLHLYRELMRAEDDIDLPARLSALTNAEIRITKIAAGDLSPEALHTQYTLSAAPDPGTDDTMVRIRARMAEQPQESDATPAAREDAPLPELEDEAPPAYGDAPGTPAQEPAAIDDPLPPQEEDDMQSDLAPIEKKRGAGGVIALILLILFLGLFIWLLGGILMDMDILPFYDLGYSYFNENVFEFFRLP